MKHEGRKLRPNSRGEDRRECHGGSERGHRNFYIQNSQALCDLPSDKISMKMKTLINLNNI